MGQRYQSASVSVNILAVCETPAVELHIMCMFDG